MNRNEVIYARDVDGTGSLHACSKEDPGAFAFRCIGPVQLPHTVEGVPLELYNLIKAFGKASRDEAFAGSLPPVDAELAREHVAWVEHDLLKAIRKYVAVLK